MKAIGKAGELLFTGISTALQRESFAGLVGGMTLKCENRIECYTARCILFFVDSAKSISVLWSEEGDVKKIEKGANDCSKIPRGGVLPCMGYIGMCRCEGNGFQAVYSRIGYINQNIWV